MKIVLIGAGSAQFGYGNLGDIYQSKTLRGAEICLMDINGESVKKVEETALAFAARENLDFTINSTTDLTKALNGADFVIISIEVGDRFELWDMDWAVGRKYGIPQVYGENGGPGGLFHALRIIPPILEISHKASEICPEAFLFCYSNPMTAICTTIKRDLPELNFIGLCHEIASLERYLPPMLDTSFDNLKLRAAGLNHFSVLLEAFYKDSGKDAYPDILAKAPDYFENEPGYSDLWKYYKEHGVSVETEGSTKSLKKLLGNSSRSWSDRTLFKEILESFKLLPITGDSHIGEYISWADSCADHQGILDFYDFYRNALAHVEPKIEMQLHERVVPIMEAIVNDTGAEESAVNILNKGLIPSLPDFIAVEVPAKVSAKGLEGIAFPDYPKGFAGLLRNYTGVYDLTAEAVLKQSREYVRQALLVNPMVGNVHKLDELVDVMVDRQSPWLNYLK